MMTQVKTIYSLINHSTYEVTDSTSTNCRNDIWAGLKSLTLADSDVITECHKFESADWHKVKVAFKFYQI